MTVSPFDRGLLYGDGLFETMLVRGGRVPLLRRHLDRLAESASLIDLTLPPDVADRVASDAAALGDGAIRLTVTRGTGRRGYDPPPDAQPTVLVQASPYSPPSRPWRAVIAQGVRANPASILWRIKSLSALEKVMARTEAVRAGADEALLLNGEGALAEGAATNLFLVIGDEAVTPPLSAGCLPGVARGVMLERGARERTLHLTSLQDATEAFLTNALAGVIPLVSIGDTPFSPGPVTERFRAMWQEAVSSAQ